METHSKACVKGCLWRKRYLLSGQLSVYCLFILLKIPVSERNVFSQVRHRWCELIVKHKHTAAYKDVEQFLKKDQVGFLFLLFLFSFALEISGACFMKIGSCF